jgi:hypothetical protein
MEDRKVILSTLWLFATLNWLYADVIALFDVVYNGKGAASMQFNQGTLIGVSILMAIPIAMIVLSQVLRYRANRWTNIIVGTAYTFVTLTIQFIVPILNGTTTSYYLFFGALEILATVSIVWYAWKWHNLES